MTGCNLRALGFLHLLSPWLHQAALSSFLEQGYFDDLTVMNEEGHELMKPKLRPGGADTSEDCQKEDRLLTARQERLDADLENLRKQFEPKLTPELVE